MMKWLLWILLLANLIFFSFMQWGETILGTGKMSPNLAELNAEKIKILPTSFEVPVATSQPSSATLLTYVPAAPQEQPTHTVACLEWGEFSGADLARASKALAALNLGSKMAQRQVEYASGYWAYIPPPKTRAEIERKVAVLKARGVDHFVVQESGKWHNAISLGVFKTGEAAHKFLDSLKEKSIKTVLVGERKSKLTFTVFVLKELDAGENEKAKALQAEFSGSELKAVTCNNPVSANPIPSQLTSGR